MNPIWSLFKEVLLVPLSAGAACAHLVRRLPLAGVLLVAAFLWPYESASARDERVGVTVSVARDVSGLIVTYTFASARTELAFDPAEPLPPDAVISAVSRGVEFANGAARWAEPARRLVIRVAPDRAVRAGAYPTLITVEEGAFLVYLPALAPDPARFETRWRFRAGRDGQAIAPAPGTGFAFLGPRHAVHRRGAIRVVGGGDAPARRDAVLDRTVQLIAFYTDRLGPLPTPPVVLVLPSADPQSSALAGEATPNSVVVAPRWREDSEQFDHVLAHELFHLWNARGFSARAGHNDYWLLEGSAEYAAAVAVRSLWPERDGLRERLNNHLAPCRITRGGSPLDGLDAQRAFNTAYSCGMLAHWALDAGIKDMTDGRTDVFSIWRPLFAGRWDGAAFDAALARRSTAVGAIRALRDASGEGSWLEFVRALSATGAVVEVTAPTDSAYREASLFTVLRAACGAAGLGFEQSTEGAIRLDVGPNCAIAPWSELVSIGAYEADDDWSAIYAYLGARCSSAASVGLRLRQGGSIAALTVACATVAPLREEWQVTTLFRGQ